MRTLLIIALAISLQGCLAYTAASTGSMVVTGKSLTDYGATYVTGNDCKTLQLFEGKYYCEDREPGTTYNRNPY